jgi:hypothetical protein
VLDIPADPGLLSIVLMNKLLRVLLKRLQKFERPISVTVAERNLSVKVRSVHTAVLCCVYIVTITSVGTQSLFRVLLHISTDCC